MASQAGLAIAAHDGEFGLRLAGRSRPCPDRRLEAACRALSRASRRTRGRSRSTAAACSPTRPGRRSGLSEQVPPLRLQWRRRRDHRDVDELVGDRAVDEVELHGRLYGGDEELLVAHCPGLFHKPRISGHVNRAPDDSRATHSGVRGVPWVRKTGSSDPTFRLIGVRYAESVSAAGQAAKAAAGRFGGRSLAETLTLSNNFTLETSSRWMCELAHLAPSCLQIGRFEIGVM